jgi:DHA1 family tetracycline resistance protein-like MFS transporter
MFSGLISGAVQALLVKKLVPKLGETRAVVFGMCVSFAAQICYGLATEGWMIYVIILVGSVAGISGPSLQSYITHHVPANEQGAVQGVFSGLQSLAGIPAPFIATWSFGWAISPERSFHLPGIAFFEAAALVIVALFLATRTFRRFGHGGAAAKPA